MKKFFLITMLALIAPYAFAETDIVKPTPTPSSHRYGYKTNSSTRKKIDSDDDKSKSIHCSTIKKKTVKKTDDDDADRSTPTPTPSRKKPHKVVKDDDEESARPEPAPSSTSTPEPSPSAALHPNSDPNASLTSDEIANFDKQPDKVQKLLESALALTRQNLTYTYGSADPANGGMDCSGFVYYVLRQNGFTDVPRDASGQYVWVRKAKLFQAVLSMHKDTFELDDLRPGDLLFWTGTYNSQKDPPITHAMIYLGTEKKTHKSVMVGSTDGRTYDGKSRWGVSVFDFKANAQSPVAALADPKKQTHAAFVGYAHIPGLHGD